MDYLSVSDQSFVVNLFFEDAILQPEKQTT